MQPGAGAGAEGGFELLALATAAGRRGCGSPIRSSLITVFGPIPGTSPGDSAAKRSSASSRESTTSPAGLPSSLVIFASIRLSEIPTEQVRPVSRRISVATRRIVAFGEKIPVRSR